MDAAYVWRQTSSPLSQTMEAEYMALTEAMKELEWVRQLLTELGSGNGETINVSKNLHSDNQSAIALAENPVSHARAKHIDLRHHFIREAIQDKVVRVQYIPTAEMTADSLTKALGCKQHEKCAALMGIS